MTTEDIVAFVQERLDEDAIVAQDAGARSMEWELAEQRPVPYGQEPPALEILSGGRLYMTFEQDRGAPLAVDHVLQHDPARVLRGVDAKRRIVGEHGELGIEGYCAKCGTHDTNGEGDLLYEHDEYPCRTLRLLASEWSTHEDFRPEWSA